MNNIESKGKFLAYMLAMLYFLFFLNSESFVMLILIVVMVTVGVPHGAIDHILPTKYLQLNGLFKFIIKYLIIILVYAIAWFFIPKISLLLFLIISAYHFGQVHYISFEKIKKAGLLYFLTGNFILSLILIGDYDKSTEILSAILDIQPFEKYIYIYLCASFFLFLVILTFQNKNVKLQILKDLIPLSLLLYFTPLLLSFVLYFGFWHSLPMLLEEYRGLNQEKEKMNVKSFVKKLLPLTIVSLLGILIILYFSNKFLQSETLIMIFFILISLISAPHIVVMDEFLKRKSSILPS